MMTLADKPYPWTCGNCATKTVIPEDQQVAMKVLHNGTLIPIYLPCVSVPTCTECGSQWFSIEQDDIVQREVEKQYKLLQAKYSITNMINELSLENLSDTPDYILAEYLINCLINFNNTTNRRNNDNNTTEQAKTQEVSQDISKSQTT